MDIKRLRIPLPKVFSRPAHTLFYITQSTTFRVDFDRKGDVLGEIHPIEIACKSSNTLPNTLEQLLADDQPKVGRKVWLLYNRLPTYLLSLPSVQVEGVEPEVLEQALQFEYEGMTGHSAGKSFLSHHYIGTADDMANYWITLVAQETLAKIKAILHKKRCQYGGLCHAGGLPVLISGADVPSWFRIEHWPGSVFMLAKTPELGLTLQILHTKQNPDWQLEVDQWIMEIGEVDKSETLIGDQMEYMAHTDENYKLSSDGALVFWLSLWAKHLATADDLQVPLLNPQKRLNKDIVYMVAGGVSAALLCGAHFSVNWYFKQDFEFKTQELSQLESESGNLSKTIATLRDKVDALNKDVSLMEKNVDQIPAALSALQNRPLALLDALARYSPDDLVIEQISPEHDTILITGYALKPYLVNQLTTNIEPSISALGWKLEPATKKAMGLFEDDGPWQFSFALLDQGLEGFINATHSTQP
ncbi:PilN domain-containing protein [methane-oxidizing endosymbiont of Gigantopelta aegis]|uniref:PilN domain-containing protein n=1 Tax=methane-oxidizing endosymbiont of Gigantopelta aegis TaxID=2794938 RepID=UPI0018DB69B4|nr:PilN domain-containing protein [methane-oxidizing endosymbiont of Gigantopelta aegis]